MGHTAFNHDLCVASIIQPDDDQKLANNKFRENTLIQTPTEEDPFQIRKDGVLSSKEINQAHFGMDNKFVAYTVHGNLILYVYSPLLWKSNPPFSKTPKISNDK